MNLTITAEHFELTPPIRNKVGDAIRGFQDLLPENASLSVFLTASLRHRFGITYRLRFPGHEILAHDEGREMYSLIHDAAQILKRNLLKERRKQWQRNREVTEIDEHGWPLSGTRHAQLGLRTA